jgi:Glyoxalase-like domain
MLGNVISGSRQLTDGTILNWKLTDLSYVVAEGIVPFFIDWGQSPHPASTTPTGATLVNLRAEHPDADRVRKMLEDLALDLAVTLGPVPALVAEIDCPNGRVLLR